MTRPQPLQHPLSPPPFDQNLV